MCPYPARKGGIWTEKRLRYEKKKKPITLDGGTLEERIKKLKEFCRLRPDQSFADLPDYDVDDDKNTDT